MPPFDNALAADCRITQLPIYSVLKTEDSATENVQAMTIGRKRPVWVARRSSATRDDVKKEEIM